MGPGWYHTNPTASSLPAVCAGAAPCVGAAADEEGGRGSVEAVLPLREFRGLSRRAPLEQADCCWQLDELPRWQPRSRFPFPTPPLWGRGERVGVRHVRGVPARARPATACVHARERPAIQRMPRPPFLPPFRAR